MRMKINADSVALTSVYVRAARVSGIILLIWIGGIGGTILFKADYSFVLPLILMVVLSLSAMLAMSHGDVIFSKDKIEIFRNIMWYKYYKSMPTGDFTALRIKRKSSGGTGEQNSMLYYVMLIHKEGADKNYKMTEVTGTGKPKVIYDYAENIVAVTGWQFDIDERLIQEFPKFKR